MLQAMMDKLTFKCLRDAQSEMINMCQTAREAFSVTPSGNVVKIPEPKK